MRQGKFDKLLERRIELIKSVLSSKGEEYGTSDRLHNFKVAANIGHFLNKHCSV